MRPKIVYLLLGVAGTVLPGVPLLMFLREHGLAPGLLLRQLFSTPAGAFFGLDVILSSVVLWAFVFFDGPRAGVRHLWAPIAANLLVGVSFGLPLFLFLRELRLEQAAFRQPTLPAPRAGEGP